MDSVSNSATIKIAPAGTRPEHARNFAGRAKNIPERDTFWLPYQHRWIHDTSILKLMEKSRRIGISYSTAYATVRKHSKKSHHEDTWASSRDEGASRLFVKDCKLFTRLLKTAASDLGATIIEKEAIHEIQFTNGTVIHSLASNPDVFAGKGGNVLLDEFALRDDPAGVYAIASPSIDWGGELEIISTHRGSQNFFNQLIVEITQKNNPKNFSHHRVTLQDALDQGFLWKLQTKLQQTRPTDPRLDMDEADYFNYQKSRAKDLESFEQEYMCNPADDITAFLEYDLITACELKYPDHMVIDTEITTDHIGRKGTIRTLSLHSGGSITTGADISMVGTVQPADVGWPLYVGVDIGRDHDLTVIWCAAQIAGILVPIKIIEMSKVSFSRQEKELYNLLEIPQVRRGCIDNTGIGKQFAERAQERYGAYRIEAVTFTAGSKEEMAYPVRTGMEDRTLRVPDDDAVRADLRAIKKEQRAGNVRFSSDRGKNGHSDRFWALALMRNAVGKTDREPLRSGSVHTRPRLQNATQQGRLGAYLNKIKNIIGAY